MNTVAHNFRQRAIHYLRQEERPPDDRVLSFLEDLLAFCRVHGPLDDGPVRAVLMREAGFIEEHFDAEEAMGLFDVALPEVDALSSRDEDLLTNVLSATCARTTSPDPEPAAPTPPLPVRTLGFWQLLGLFSGATACFLMGLMSGQLFEEVVPLSPPSLATPASVGPLASVPVSHIARDATWTVGLEQDFDFSWTDPGVVSRGGAADTRTAPAPRQAPLSLEVVDLTVRPEGESFKIQLTPRTRRRAHLSLYHALPGRRPHLVHSGTIEPGSAPIEWKAPDASGNLLALASEEALVLKGEEMNRELVGLRPGAPALEGVRVWTFTEARNRQTTLSTVLLSLKRP